jgi:hypothetical protein
VVGERFENVGVDGGVFDRCVGPDKRRGVFEFCWIGRDVGDQIAVAIAIHGVELATVRADVLSWGRGRERCSEHGYQGNALSLELHE